ncbi:hypothetical protein PIB30_081925 [Stylosanthes scabra]|uniref:Uncharacterized protein n=1 Tax=Stylosanthes scabra TaxID=79078 RepID=A0ABU6UUH8_9FABA|nr:hypothetical protein [Stylosanthes scabra]
MTKLAWTRKEMQVITKEFIHHGEVNRVVAATKNPQAHTSPRGSVQTHNPRDNQRDSRFRCDPRPPKQKFDNYTPLLASITEIYQIRTQDCYDLKDAIEQVIWDGRLKEFVKIIREPRNSDRERSPRPEPRNLRNRKDDDDPIMEVVVIDTCVFSASAPNRMQVIPR